MSLLDDAASSSGSAAAPTRIPSIEYPTMLRVDGKPPAMAIIETLSPTECRLRSVAILELDTHVECDFSVQGAAKVVVRGRVALRTQHGARNSYRIALDSMSLKEKSDLGEAAQAAVRHAATRLVADVPSAHGLTRASVRVPVDMAVTYRNERNESHRGKATNLSAGGMFFRTDEPLDIGASLQLAFVLASSEVGVHGRIVAHHQSADGSFDYNIAFHGMEPGTRDAISAYVDRIAGGITTKG